MDEKMAVEAALETLRPSLESDGFELRMGSWPTETSVDIILQAKTGACLDCLVPDNMLTQVIENAIRSKNVPIDHVNLVKEGFEESAAH
jgi:Fe-S cluster biogenesis protein NfuA